jgi:hypothetical protein
MSSQTQICHPGYGRRNGDQEPYHCHSNIEERKRYEHLGYPAKYLQIFRSNCPPVKRQKALRGIHNYDQYRKDE